MLFSDRLAVVVGPQPYAWAARHGVPKGTMRSWLSTENPQAKSLKRLVEASGVPLEWWLSGDGPPPTRGVLVDIEVDTGPLNVEERRASYGPLERCTGKINVKALAAIIEGALKTAPHASPQAIAEHSAKIYAQAIQDGLITPDGVGPGKVDKAA